MITDYLYNDVILYAKGWYERKDIVEDLSYLFSRIYGWNPNESDSEQATTVVANYMLMVLDDLNENGVRMRYTVYTRFGFISEVRRYQSLYELSFDMAVIRVVMSVLLELSKDDIKLNPPHFGKKEHFRLGRLGQNYPISMTYTSMNKIVQDFFK